MFEECFTMIKNRIVKSYNFHRVQFRTTGKRETELFYTFIIRNLMRNPGLQDSTTSIIIFGILVMHRSFCYWLPQY